MKLGGESAKLQITMMIVFTIRNTHIHFFPVRLSGDAGATRKRDKNAPCLRIVPNGWTHTPQRVSESRLLAANAATEGQNKTLPLAEESSADSITVCSPSFHVCVCVL